jgi:hypothetical protein
MIFLREEKISALPSKNKVTDEKFNFGPASFHQPLCF